MTQQPELPWIAYARQQIGTREIPGKQHNAKIMQWLKNLKSWIADDETPWCGTFVAECLRANKLWYPAKFPAAKSFLELAVPLPKPAYGCIVVFSRNGGGHVGFVVGKDKAGNLMVLGGNQSNAVNIKPFALSRVVGYRWPSIYPTPQRFNLPVLTSDGRVSVNEA